MVPNGLQKYIKLGIKEKLMAFFGWLTVLFVGLKLTGYIDWSWWLVLLPFYWLWALLLTAGLLVVVVKTIEEIKK